MHLDSKMSVLDFNCWIAIVFSNHFLTYTCSTTTMLFSNYFATFFFKEFLQCRYRYPKLFKYFLFKNFKCCHWKVSCVCQGKQDINESVFYLLLRELVAPFLKHCLFIFLKKIKRHLKSNLCNTYMKCNQYLIYKSIDHS